MRGDGIRRRVGEVLRRPALARAGDPLIAFVLALSSVIPVLGGDPSWGTNKPVAIALAVFSTAPVAWRARWPLTVAAIVLVANAGCVFAATPHQAAFQPFVALVLVAYSVGSRAEGSRALWLPPILVVATVPLFVAAVRRGQDPGNAIPSFVWLTAAWAVGRTARGWRMKSVELEAANRQLAEQRELQAHAAVMVERGRIARELHDVIAHNVSMMVVQAGAAARVLRGEQSQVRDALEVIAATGRQTVDEMRTVLGVLRSEGGPSALRPQPGLADLDALAQGVQEAGLPVTVRIEGEPRPLPQALDLSAYRIVQEALTNVLKHAGPARAEVTVRYESGSVELEIVDTGVGGTGVAMPSLSSASVDDASSSNGAGSGHGLVGMRERAAMFGGELEAAASHGGGFVVRARLPLGASA